MQFDLIFKNNAFWVEQQKKRDPDFFKKLALGQNPDYLYIGCSDSRVSAEELLGAAPGELFVHRNIANLVVGTDNNINAVIQYAVEFLKVKHIIVCGHYECGGIKAAMQQKDNGQLNSWLQQIRDVYRTYREELDAISDEQKRYDRLVELNVREQCLNIMKIDHVQRAWLKRDYPHIHGWIFDVRTGCLTDLNLDTKQMFELIKGIYEIRPR